MSVPNLFKIHIFSISPIKMGPNLFCKSLEMEMVRDLTLNNVWILLGFKNLFIFGFGGLNLCVHSICFNHQTHE